jgi:hypothetical protein
MYKIGKAKGRQMRFVAETAEEAMSLAVGNMPNESELSDINGRWRVARTMGNVWTVTIKGAAVKAREMHHVEPHRDVMMYETGEMAAEAINLGWHTAYGDAVS